jgi:hypothetical protein
MKFISLDIPFQKKNSPCNPSEKGISQLYNNPEFWIGTTKVRIGINSQLLSLSLSQETQDITKTNTFKQWLGYEAKP